MLRICYNQPLPGFRRLQKEDLCQRKKEWYSVLCGPALSGSSAGHDRSAGGRRHSTVYRTSRGHIGKLANRYGTTVSEVKVLNGLKSDYLFVGQKLSIPTAEAGLTTYYVQPGDTFTSSAFASAPA